MMDLSRSGFQNYTKYAFKLVKQVTDFIDVTLAYEDGKLGKAHKVVHGSSSCVVQSILKNSTHLFQSAPSRD